MSTGTSAAPSHSAPIATDLGYPVVTSDDVIPGIAADLLHTFYGKNPAMDARISQILEEEQGFFAPLRDGVTPTFLLGFPAQGKTTSFKQAARWVADKLGLDLLIDPPDSMLAELTDKHLVFMTFEMSGEMTNTGTVGLPTVRKEEVNGQTIEYTAYIPERRLFMASMCPGYSVVCYDDALNAAPHIQNVLLSLMLEKRFRQVDLGRHTYVGLTGNLGAMDNTHTSAMSSALMTRGKAYVVEDRLDRWVERTQKQFNSAVGDGGVSKFLELNPDLFHKPARGKSRFQPYPAPRTWSKFSAVMENIALGLKSKFEAGTMTDAFFDKQMMRVFHEAGSLVGQEAAGKFRAWSRAMQSEALPLAMKAIDEGRFDEGMTQRFLGKMAQPASLEAVEFAHQYAISVAEHAAARVAKVLPATQDGQTPEVSAEVRTVYQRMTRALLSAPVALSPHNVNMAVDHFMVRMASMDGRVITKDQMAVKPYFTPAQYGHMKAIYAAFKQEGAEQMRPRGSDKPENWLQSIVAPSLTGTQMVSSIMGNNEKLFNQVADMSQRAEASQEESESVDQAPTPGA